MHLYATHVVFFPLRTQFRSVTLLPLVATRKIKIHFLSLDEEIFTPSQHPPQTLTHHQAAANQNERHEHVIENWMIGGAVSFYLAAYYAFP